MMLDIFNFSGLWRSNPTREDQKRMWLKRGTGSGERARRTGKGKKLEQKRELEMKLLIGLGLKLGFLPTIHYRVCHCRSPLLVLLTSRKKQTGRRATKSFVSTYKKWNVAIVQQKEEIYKKRDARAKFLFS